VVPAVVVQQAVAVRTVTLTPTSVVIGPPPTSPPPRGLLPRSSTRKAVKSRVHRVVNRLLPATFHPVQADKKRLLHRDLVEVYRLCPAPLLPAAHHHTDHCRLSVAQLDHIHRIRDWDRGLRVTR